MQVDTLLTQLGRSSAKHAVNPPLVRASTTPFDNLAEFKQSYAPAVATLRSWEQGRFTPPGGVVCLLRLIIKHPELSQELSGT